MTLTTGIAIYGAVVSTAAAALSIRRWLLAGPQLSLSVIARGKAFGGGDEDSEYLCLTVVNRGDLATTITNMGAFQYKTILRRWRRRPYWAAIVPHPSAFGGPEPPFLLAPGTRWMGMIKYDPAMTERVKKGDLFVAIHASHTNRPAIKRVRWELTPKEKADLVNTQQNSS